MSKEAMRQESERLVREAMARNVTITHGKTRLDVKCWPGRAEDAE